MTLGVLFRNQTGSKEVRIPSQGMACIEFETEQNAIVAHAALNGFKLSQTVSMKLYYV